ncbi:DUF2809 domain-containing protein [Microbacterium sp. A93]|uniref:ribosomal maturation YjgA family protein n=1 Tax=unclassified Microbacterium TaxID=2609290 RepID=UPI003F423290
MSPAAQRSSTRRRLVVASAAVLTVCAGLLVHRFGTGVQGDIVGDALYAVLIYLVLVFLMPRTPRTVPAALAIIFCTCIELLQLTDVPSTIAAEFPPAALVFGASFDQRDILVYAFAVVAVMLLDVAVTYAARRSTRHPAR